MEIKVNKEAKVYNQQDLALLQYYKQDYFIINLFRVIGPNFAEIFFNQLNHIDNLCTEMCFTKEYLHLWSSEALNLTSDDIDFFYLLTRFHPTWTPRIGQIAKHKSKYSAREIRWMSEFKGKYWQPDISDMDFLRSSADNSTYVVTVLAKHHRHWNPSRALLDETISGKVSYGYTSVSNVTVSIAEMLAFLNKQWTTTDPELLSRKVNYPDARDRTIAELLAKRTKESLQNNLR